jgi:L-ornithine N5-oxygenase
MTSTSAPTGPDETRVHDLLGVGFGPSNLALAVALADEPHEPSALSALFLERQPRFGWHRGMLFDDATMQVSFLKDLVTLRNPASRFSFLCYLQAKDRLIDFINAKNLFPLRVEFHDYLEWAAAQVDHLVRYRHEVVELRTTAGGAYVEVVARGPEGTTTHRARNVVFATGLEPNLPDGVVMSDRVWHNRDLLHRVDRLRGTAPRRFVVVGAGQSAAEVTSYLHREFPEAEVCAVFSRYGYSPADDSPFANRIFDPAAVDDFFGASPETKKMLHAYHANTNYSVVDGELIEELYARRYQEKVLGKERLRMLNVSRLVDATETNDGVRATIELLTSGEKVALDADLLVCATGYRPADPSPLLGNLAPHCLRDGEGRLVVGRDYRIGTTPELRAGLYLQGGTEHTHGITSSLLSNTAIRADDILRSVRDNELASR